MGNVTSLQFFKRGSPHMSRKLFDRLTSSVGVLMVVVLLVAGGLLTWGHSFVNSNVHSQLARQDITFPSSPRPPSPTPSPAAKSPRR
jgi:hypothetical protein